MRFRILAVAQLLTAPLLGGCFTFVGGGVGYLVDSGKPDYEVASRADLLAQDSDREVLVADRDGIVHRGRFRGIQAESGEPLTLAYQRWRAALPDSLRPPSVGMEVVVWTRGEGEPNSRRGTFVGFDSAAVYLESGNGGSATPWAAIDRLTGPGGAPYALPPPPDSTGAPPRIGAVELLVGTEAVETIGWDDIRTVELKRAKHGMRNGALIGLGLDVATLVIFAATWDSSWGWN